MPAAPHISFVLATHNRRDVALATLQRLYCVQPSGPSVEIIVVDNASADGTADAIRTRFRDVRLIELHRNLGSCAKALGADVARGEIVVFLDDDSFPRAGSIALMLRRFEDDPRLGAAGFRVHLPDGREECSALPDVFVGCGVGLRREALEEVGGLDRAFFMQAEEYDLSFRLASAGWDVRVFGDLHVDHLKSPLARVGARTVYYDTRNNLAVAARYLPDACFETYRADWAQRYGWIAQRGGATAAHWRGRSVAAMRRGRERRRWRDRRLTPQAFERFFSWSFVGAKFEALRDTGVESVLLADLGKNIYAFTRAARRTGMKVACIADDRFASPGRLYRGIPVVSVEAGVAAPCDVVVIANTSAVHAAATELRFKHVTSRPIFRWFGYDLPAVPIGSDQGLPPRCVGRAVPV